VYTYFVWEVLQPLPILLILMGIVLLWLWYRGRESRRVLLVLTIPYGLLVAFSVPALAYQLRGSLEWRHGPVHDRPADVDAIVVLSGGLYRADGPRAKPELDEDTTSRCLCAFRLYRQGKHCPILVSGGQASSKEPPPGCAETMRDLLIEWGVNPADLIVEPHSRTTYENAVESCKLLQERGLRKVILVTSAIHLARSVACFRKQGFDVLPCPCQLRATPADSSRHTFLPSVGALQDSQRACHEWLGMAWYWLKGRI
jgi:uncharacterized SAM-binding protein YcdF (DUF218 family)